MAFTEPQRVQIRLMLGYPDVFRSYNPRLEGVFDVIGSRPDTQAAVVDLLTKIAALDLQLGTILSLAGLKRAEDVEWYQALNTKMSAPMQAVATLGRIYIGRMSALMGVPIYSDFFGTGGYAGDNYMGIGNQQSGGVIPLG